MHACVWTHAHTHTRNGIYMFTHALHTELQHSLPFKFAPKQIFYFYFVVLYISTAQGNQPRRDLNIWTKFHGFEKHGRARLCYVWSSGLCSGLPFGWAGAPCLGQIPPGARGSKCLSHICSGRSKHAKAPVKADLELCYPPFLHLKTAHPHGPINVQQDDQKC